jgi:hypothetical protein
MQRKSTLRIVEAPTEQPELAKFLAGEDVESSDLLSVVTINPKTTACAQVFIKTNETPVSPFISDGDYVLFDKALRARPGDIVLCETAGGFRFEKYAPGLKIVAVATASFHLFRKGGAR